MDCLRSKTRAISCTFVWKPTARPWIIRNSCANFKRTGTGGNKAGLERNSASNGFACSRSRSQRNAWKICGCWQNRRTNRNAAAKCSGLPARSSITLPTPNLFSGRCGGRRKTISRTICSSRGWGKVEQVLSVVSQLHMAATNPLTSSEKIMDRWSTLIEGANGKGTELLDAITRDLRDVQVPKLRLSRKDVSRRKALSLGPQEHGTDSRTYLVVENEYLESYKMYVGVSDYGKQLSVQWYLLLEPRDWTGSLIGAGVAALVVIALFALKWWLGLIGLLVGGFFLYWHYKKNAKDAEAAGAGNLEYMDLFDLEELSNYVTTVHHAATGSVEHLMTGMSLDFSKVDTRSKGFLKIS